MKIIVGFSEDFNKLGKNNNECKKNMRELVGKIEKKEARSDDKSRENLPKIRKIARQIG